MTPLPKKKHTRGRSNRRKNAATNMLKIPGLVRCGNCGKFKFPHKVCKACGSYK